MPVKSELNWDCIYKTALTIAPVAITGLKWYLFLNKNDQLEWYEKIKKPSWCIKDPAIKAALDLAVVAPTGYAASLVFKEGRGSDLQTATALYGAGVLLYLAGIPAFVNTKDLKCWFGISALATAVSGATAAAFYKIDNNAGLMLVPLTVWMGFETLGLASAIQGNPGF